MQQLQAVIIMQLLPPQHKFTHEGSRVVNIEGGMAGKYSALKEGVGGGCTLKHLLNKSVKFQALDVTHTHAHTHTHTHLSTQAEIYYAHTLW